MKEVKFLFNYLKKEIMILVISLILSCIIVVSLTLIPYFLGLAVDVLASPIDGNSSTIDFNLLYYNLSICLVLLIVLVIFQFIFDSLLGTTIERLVKNLRSDLVKKINKLSLSSLDSMKKGDVVTRVINDCDNVSIALLGSIRQFFTGIVQIIVTLIFMLYLNWIMGLIVIILTPLSFVLSLQVSKRSRKLYKDVNRLIGLENANLLELLNNIETSKSYGYDEVELENFKVLNDEMNKVGRKAQFISSLTNPVSRLINNLTTLCVVGVGILLYIVNLSHSLDFLQISISIGLISTFLQYSNQFSKPFNEVTSCFGEIQNGLSSLRRIKSLFDIPNDFDEGEEIEINSIDSIVFNHVYFSYDKVKDVIHDFNLSIDTTQKIAFCGPTGCGKTTLINLLLRFYDVDKGEILINGMPIKRIKKSSLRRAFGMVLQETWIFSGDVRENIIYGKDDATQEEVIESCKKSNCLDFIVRLPNGFDTLIKNDDSLSYGQKQLISIARVMLLDKKALIFDEATSNIDTRTEAIITKAANELTKNKTSFIIAHRLNTIKESDLIVCLKDGRIIEQGNHQELLSKKGFYYELFNAQFD